MHYGLMRRQQVCCIQLTWCKLSHEAEWAGELIIICVDRPTTDLYETEGTGGWPGAHFMARPVIGGHFAYLTLEKACGGKALEGLAFLNDDDDKAAGSVRDQPEVDDMAEEL